MIAITDFAPSVEYTWGLVETRSLKQDGAMKRRVVAIANKSVFVFATSFNRLDLESVQSVPVSSLCSELDARDRGSHSDRRE